MPQWSITDIIMIGGAALSFGLLALALAWGVWQTKDVRLVAATAPPLQQVALSPDNVLQIAAARRAIASWETAKPVARQGTLEDDAA